MSIDIHFTFNLTQKKIIISSCLTAVFFLTGSDA